MGWMNWCKGRLNAATIHIWNWFCIYLVRDVLFKGKIWELWKVTSVAATMKFSTDGDPLCFRSICWRRFPKTFGSDLVGCQKSWRPHQWYPVPQQIIWEWSERQDKGTWDLCNNEEKDLHINKQNTKKSANRSQLFKCLSHIPSYKLYCDY